MKRQWNAIPGKLFHSPPEARGGTETVGNASSGPKARDPTGSGGGKSPTRSMGKGGREPWMNWRGRGDLTGSTVSEGVPSATKRFQQMDDSSIKAMRLEDQSLSPATLSKESGEMANIEDRLGASGIDSASKSGISSKPD